MSSQRISRLILLIVLLGTGSALAGCKPRVRHFVRPAVHRGVLDEHRRTQAPPRPRSTRAKVGVRVRTR